MIKELIHDPIFLAQPSSPATIADLPTAKDLMDTLLAHKSECVGMAANMIGVKKCIIAFNNEGNYMIMFNPKIIERKGEYTAEEGCLSLLGGLRKATRFNDITVSFQTERFQPRTCNFSGFTAQIIQHEIDHCLGILI